MDRMVTTLIDLVDELMDTYYGKPINRAAIAEFDGTCGGEHIPLSTVMHLIEYATIVGFNCSG